MKTKILKILESANDYVSGEELSKRLGVSRTAIWKNINSLRNDGCVISSATNRGYRLDNIPDLLDGDIISDRLDTSVIGKKIEILRTIDSTNDEVKRRAAVGEPSGLIIAAEEQTKGKGRLGKSWDGHRGGLFFTALIRPELSPVEISSITLAAGYGVCLAIREYTGLDARIKWPNDIIIGGKKIVGILTEIAAQADMLDYAAIGIGINVNNRSFPEEISSKATSLFMELGKEINRNDFFRCVIGRLDKVISSFIVSMSIDDISSFTELCATIGRRVSVQRGAGLIEGKATGINPNGELIIVDDDSMEYIINSGEVAVQGIY